VDAQLLAVVVLVLFFGVLINSFLYRMVQLLATLSLNLILTLSLAILIHCQTVMQLLYKLFPNLVLHRHPVIKLNVLVTILVELVHLPIILKLLEEVLNASNLICIFILVTIL
jgi:hypothetical protein